MRVSYVDSKPKAAELGSVANSRDDASSSVPREYSN